MALPSKIAVLANCQGQPITKFISACLDGFDATYISNNARTGDFASPETILETLGTFDVLVYHPLGAEHGAISEAAIRQAYPQLPIIRLAYIFNSGTMSLGYAPFSGKNSYGEVFGEEAIIAMIQQGLSPAQIATRFEQGDGLPSLPDRFRADLNTLRQRERGFELKITDFIAENYHDSFLFLTHNHPTAALFRPLFRRLTALIAPEQLAALEQRIDALPPSTYDLPPTGGAISPFDAKVQNYRFGYHSDYQKKQAHLIDLVWRKHALGEDVKPSVYASLITVPDAI